MARYGGYKRSFSGSTSNDNWSLTAGTGKSGKILEFSWGGEMTSSTSVATRTARSSSQTGSTTAITNAKLHPNSPNSGMVLGSTFATTQPTLDTGGLFELSWNAHGGTVRWLAAPGEELFIIGAATETVISNRNTAQSATPTLTAGLIWEED